MLLVYSQLPEGADAVAFSATFSAYPISNDLFTFLWLSQGINLSHVPKLTSICPEN